MSFTPGSTARTLYTAARAIPPDTAAETATIALFNTAVQTAIDQGQAAQAIIATTTLARLLNAQYEDLTITTPTDLTPAYKAQLVSDLTTAGYIVTTNAAGTTITATFPP
jgi:hypothetical protein